MPHAPLPPEFAGSAFTTAQARAAGVGRGRLRGRDVTSPHRGVHIALSDARDDDVMARCERLIPVLAPHHWFSHRTAARIWGIPLRPGYHPVESLHVISIGSRAPLRHAGTTGWVTKDARVRTEMFGVLPVVSPADTWCHLAARSAVIEGEVISHEWLVAAGDFLTTGRRRRGGERDAPLYTVDDLRAAIERRGSRRGIAELRRALTDVRSPVDSPYETRLRLGLVRAGLPEPDVQVPIMTPAGIRHADLGYPAARVLIEYQGDEHRASRERWLRDLTRVQLFQDAGYHVILVGAADVDPDCSALAERVARVLRGENTR
ncbi:hypothetical protein [Microbacterium cremeum]|uniref:hypothetical protein n=1 Tax=Microbacterium cremeum TaxID=2782169 RepID=UPI001887363B|nr:hypothetical protein [Microbacterium cremeum]